jgi:hypothetical protein
VNHVGFFTRVFEDIPVGSRNTINLIKGICCDENLVHSIFLQTNMTIFLQNEKFIKLNLIKNKDCFRILF